MKKTNKISIKFLRNSEIGFSLLLFQELHLQWLMLILFSLKCLSPKVQLKNIPHFCPRMTLPTINFLSPIFSYIFRLFRTLSLQRKNFHKGRACHLIFTSQSEQLWMPCTFTLLSMKITKVGSIFHNSFLAFWIDFKSTLKQESLH